MKKFIFMTIIIGSLVMILGCTKEMNQQDDYISCPDNTGDFCIQVYDPVCGGDGQTYSNSCEACKKVKEYKEGEC